MRICVFGLGEAGAEIAADLVRSGATVAAFDPADVATPQGVERFASPELAVEGTQVVIALTSGDDSMTALLQALDAIPGDALYADFATSSPSHKRDLHLVAAHGGISFTDVALMGTVPGNGIRTPALASGPDAGAFADLMLPLGMGIEVVGSEAGMAATRKLLRSVVVKGLAAVVIESMEAAWAAGVAEEAWRTIVEQITSADERFVRRIVSGSATHVERRRSEMDAAAALLESVGVEPVMTRSTVASLDHVRDHGIPMLPVKEG